MRKLILFSSLLLCSCESSKQSDGSERIEQRYIYIKDFEGQCLKIDTHVSVSGAQHFQSGYIAVYAIPEGKFCGEGL